MRRLLAILARLAGTAILVVVVAAAAYGIGHVTRKQPADLSRALASANGPQAPAASAPAAAPAPKAPAKRRRAPQRTPKVDRGRVVVAVLNASAAAGLAHGAASRLTTAGFAPGTVTNAGVNRTATRVFFVPGSRNAAADVARVLRVRASAVRPIDAATRALTAGAAVVVRLGSDRAGPGGA